MTSTKEMTRDEWLKERKTGIGGSDAGAILGLNPWRTPVDVWLDKTGKTQDQEPNDSMTWGNLLEDLVASQYAERTGQKVRRHNFMLREGVLLGDIDRLVCLPDGGLPAHQGVIRATKGLECKTAARDVWADGLPAHYEAQVAHYMGLSPTIQSFDIAVLFMASRKFEVFPVQRNQPVIDAMFQILREWWDRHVVNGDAPAPSCEDDCKRLWASSRGVQAVATQEVEGALLELKQIAAQISELESQESAAKTKVFAATGEADTLVDMMGKTLATWRSAKDTVKVDWRAVAEAAGASQMLVAKFSETKPGSRRFLVK